MFLLVQLPLHISGFYLWIQPTADGTYHGKCYAVADVYYAVRPVTAASLLNMYFPS